MLIIYFSGRWSPTESTKCILDNPDLCHFHNNRFDDVFKQVGDKYPNDQRMVQRYVKSSLPDKYNSCVRQLLNSGTYSPDMDAFNACDVT